MTTPPLSAAELFPSPGEPLILGIRHHSPACARLVQRSIEQLRPAWVLIEGPADFNQRLDELLLPHQLPIAIYSYCQFQEQDAPGVGAWTPFAEWSPEWQALHAARRCSADIRFIDLPVWAHASDDEADDDSQHYQQRQQAMIEACGMESSDALWDHLFEDESQQRELPAALNLWFRQLRDGCSGSVQDRQREAYMARWIAWAMAQDSGPVLVICGGWHAPVLTSLWRGYAESTEPPAPEAVISGAVTGSYLTPYSEKRLDVLAGYLSGMPAPVWQQWCWQYGQRQAGERLLERVFTVLRRQHLPASTADMANAMTQALALAALRGHRLPLRNDWLDALAGSLIKEALNTPLPWSYRGPLQAGTDPIAIVLIDVLAGHRFGVLAADTPQPPLPRDVANELKRAGITLPVTLTLNRFDTPGLLQSQVLHRLNVLEIPGISCLLGTTLALSGDGEEQWALTQPLQQHAALIEAARYGATLEEAARNRLESALADASGIAALAHWLQRAALAGLSSFSQQLLAQLEQQIALESQFEEMGPALEILYALWRHDTLNGMRDAAILLTTLRAAIERTLWLSESTGLIDPTQINAHLHSWQALCHILRDEQNNPQQHDGLVLLPRALAVLERRFCAADASALSRGAALGALIRLEHASADAQAAIMLLEGLPAARLGEALHGLIALARHQLASHPAFIAGFNRQLEQLADDEFIAALPDLRAAMAWLPPRERKALARQVLEHFQISHLPEHLLQQPLPEACSAALYLRHQQQEQRTADQLRAWGIL
ncbi:DUF5682 family protein [Erwinia sorbitola]|uniref:4-aminobutyrate aminotransferase n=1 Tax=Erwinia sorbitola TaxID=2681984 RepID=A0A6I6ET19_9GAMM|nr:DUF5682 family protein [Erwinia sorbitola]QGU87672.1 hypothetical protein GN242_10750 [Erwinia sorbitola]